MFPHLSGWPVNLALLQETAFKELYEHLDKCEGTKAIVWDNSLSGPVGLIAQYKQLKEQGVIKMYPLSADPIPDIVVKNVIFITRPNLKLMDYIAINIHHMEKKKSPNEPRKDFYLYFVPRQMELCKNLLEEKGVYGSFTLVSELKCNLFPVDNDVLSMELKDCYKELHIEGDSSCIYESASALISLQHLYGRIPRVIGKGQSAERLWELMRNMTREDKKLLAAEKGPIDQLIIIDRSTDLMSALTTQLTYEGLIDELFGINNTTAKFPADRFDLSGGQGNNSKTMTSDDKMAIVLNSGESLYSELRDKHFNEVGVILSRNAKNIISQLREKQTDRSIPEIRQYVERLPQMLAVRQSVSNHTTIAEMIKEITDSYDFMDELTCEQEFLFCADIDKPCAFIEDLMAKKAPFRTVIRLICMQCVAGSGFKQKLLDYYKRELVQVYGIDKLLPIGNLERAGLLKVQTGSRTYAVLRKTLNLTVEEPVEISPNDISYVHSLYAPLSVRMVEQLLKPNGVQSLSDTLSCLPGKTIDEYQISGTGLGGRRGSINSEMSANDSSRVILVFFLGGCTFAEISALRFLAQQEENNVEFLIATTKLINKNSFLDCFFENVSN